jgi:hypothetical protein
LLTSGASSVEPPASQTAASGAPENSNSNQTVSWYRGGAACALRKTVGDGDREAEAEAEGVEEGEAEAEALADAEDEREAVPLAETLCVLLPLWELLALADALSLLLGLSVRLPDSELLCVAPELPETVDEAVAVGVLLADELAVCTGRQENSRNTVSSEQR